METASQSDLLVLQQAAASAAGSTGHVVMQLQSEPLLWCCCSCSVVTSNLGPVNMKLQLAAAHRVAAWLRPLQFSDYTRSHVISCLMWKKAKFDVSLDSESFLRSVAELQAKKTANLHSDAFI